MNDKSKWLEETAYFIFVLGVGFILGILVTISFMPGEVVKTEVVTSYNNRTIERVVMKECNLSCLDARNEGYLVGVAECEMQSAYVTATNGLIRSYVNNTEGFYSSDGVICLQVKGQSSDQVINTLVHELIHRGIYEYKDEAHFCGVQ